MRRALEDYGDTRYARLATISVSHLYNLRRCRGYVERRRVFSKTRPTGVPICERRAPATGEKISEAYLLPVNEADEKTEYRRLENFGLSYIRLNKT